jgi:hypothetical protein
MQLDREVGTYHTERVGLSHWGGHHAGHAGEKHQELLHHHYTGVHWLGGRRQLTQVRQRTVQSMHKKYKHSAIMKVLVNFHRMIMKPDLTLSDDLTENIKIADCVRVFGV